jgi:hypothetical protein
MKRLKDAPINSAHLFIYLLVTTKEPLEGFSLNFILGVILKFLNIFQFWFKIGQ